MATREKFRMKKFIVKLSESPGIRTDVRTAELLGWVSVSNSTGKFERGENKFNSSARFENGSLLDKGCAKAAKGLVR